MSDGSHFCPSLKSEVPEFVNSDKTIWMIKANDIKKIQQDVWGYSVEFTLKSGEKLIFPDPYSTIFEHYKSLQKTGGQ
jgi:hypothetical protein